MGVVGESPSLTPSPLTVARNPRPSRPVGPSRPERAKRSGEVIQQFKIEWGEPFSSLLASMELLAFDLEPWGWEVLGGFWSGS